MPRSGRAQVNIAVDPDLKSDWQTAIDETGRWTSMTQLICQAVELELIRVGWHEAHDTGIQTTDDQSPIDVDLSGVEEQISELTRELRTLQDRVESIDLATSAMQDSELMELASELHSELPRVEKPENELFWGDQHDAEHVNWEAEAGHLAQQVDATEFDVQRALALLSEQVSRVQSTTIEYNGSMVTLHYVKDV